MQPLVTVVIPMFNEAENAAETLASVGAALAEKGWTYELVPVSDGSTDGTAGEIERIAVADANVRPVVYATNRGRGYALRRGFAVARGAIVATLDADLTYTPDVVVGMVEMLLADPEVDLVLASPYMPGGSVQGVPPVRLAFSWIGNRILRHALPRPVWTSTGIVRAYRSEALKRLSLASDGKEIHLEILSQAMALGMRIVEMPAILHARSKGRSKFRPRATVMSHLLFSVLSRPADIISGVGVALLLAALLTAGYLFSVYLSGTLNPERPLMTIMVMLFVSGAILLSFSLVAAQLVELRATMTRLHAEVRQIRGVIEGESEAARASDDA